ncbi:group II intron maturase-specific domain-containing protein [Paraburkholderia humisilvae]|uniref:Group II intron maturase-specific domain-containing protein n=3 Tax=Paraburkholderia humisilvae TaxID=627669 RepID=A0A6J5FD20_9BURK|nr:group II intron maturase-specific domain-containing protein [Paraburkholderia humisilvae]CAB3775125.1 hypothetical protein LMG29542_08507 [Paraburkholderia humisilvae]
MAGKMRRKSLVACYFFLERHCCGVNPATLKRIRQATRRWRLPRQTSGSLADLAEQCNPTIRGSRSYYGAFYRTAMHGFGLYQDRKRALGVQRKYKTLQRHKRRSEERLHKIKQAHPRQFVHWQFQGTQVGQPE